MSIERFIDATGTVTSSPAGISCTTAKFNPVGQCVATFPAGTVVTLTAVPGVENTFEGWTGAGCTGTGECQVTLNQNISVRPNFVATRYPVTIIGAGNGQGSIREPLGQAFGTPPIACAIRNGVAFTPACTTTVAYGSVIELGFSTNIAGTNVFGGFSSECVPFSGVLYPCRATITGPTTITATILARELRVRSAGGTGTGTVMSTTGNDQINCTIASAVESGACAKVYDSDEPRLITLIATPGERSLFVGWSGACTADPCQPFPDYPPNVTEVRARFELLPENTVKLVVNGNGGFGRGRVTSSPAGIDCDFSNPTSTAGTGTCLAIFPIGTTVQLTATPRDGTKVLGFTGDCASQAATCTVIMYHDRTATVQLDPTRFPVTIVGAGNGSGVVRGLGTDGGVPAVSCTITRGTAGATGCTSAYPVGSVARFLTGTNGNSNFVGYGVPPCTTSTDCSVTVTGPLTISANFAAPEVNVTGTGTGSGRVSDVAGGGLDCRITPSGTTGSCSQTLDPDSMQTITVRAQPENGSAFVGWSGRCTGTATTCTTSGWPPNVQLVAHFELVAATLTLAVRTTGHGSGTIQSSPSGIACTSTGGSPSGTCSAPLEAGATYTLSATPVAGSRFVEWGGDCTGAGTCTVTMSQTRSVSAQFDLSDTNPIVLMVAGVGTGRGIVTAAPGSAQCTFTGVVAGDACSVSYAQPTQVTLTASPQFGSTFGGWGGDACTGTALTCTFTISAATTVSVNFISPHSVHDLALALTGGFTLAPNERDGFDRLGNRNGGYDLGDLLAYLDRTGQKLTSTDAAAAMAARPAPTAVRTTRRVP